MVFVKLIETAKIIETTHDILTMKALNNILNSTRDSIDSFSWLLPVASTLHSASTVPVCLRIYVIYSWQKIDQAFAQKATVVSFAVCALRQIFSSSFPVNIKDTDSCLVCWTLFIVNNQFAEILQK